MTSPVVGSTTTAEPAAAGLLATVQSNAYAGTATTSATATAHAEAKKRYFIENPF
jgi:hypothetical protein